MDRVDLNSFRFQTENGFFSQFLDKPKQEQDISGKNMSFIDENVFVYS